jgi:hypothetical protein
VGCSNDELDIPTPTVEKNTEEIFTKTESSVSDAQLISFTLPSSEIYTLTISNTNGVISRERFNGTIGKNSMNIYTKILPKGKYQLILHSTDKKEVYKTDINVN